MEVPVKQGAEVSVGGKERLGVWVRESAGEVETTGVLLPVAAGEVERERRGVPDGLALTPGVRLAPPTVRLLLALRVPWGVRVALCVARGEKV